MDKVAEIPIPRPAETPRRPHSALRRRVLTGVLALGEIASIIGLNNQNQPANVGVDNKTDVTPAPKSPDQSFTVTPTPKESPTPPPTPEAPKYAYWSIEKITETQNAAAARGNVNLLDTVTPKGIQLLNALTNNGDEILIANGFKEGQTFDSPLGGIIADISTISDVVPVRKIYISNGSVSITLYLAAENDFLVKKGDKIEVGTPIANMTGKLLPQDFYFSQRGQIAISDQSKNTVRSVTSEKNILRDGNLLVQVQR